MREQDIEVLACPRCAAPAEDSAIEDLTKPIKCSFCGSVYALRERQEDAQQLKQELKTWLEKMMVDRSSNGSGGIDLYSRHRIFTESMYPSLEREIDRHLENLEGVSEGPLVQLEATRELSGYAPNPFLVGMNQGDNQWLKRLSSHISAQQLQDCAVMPDDKLKLKRLQLRLQSLIYYANIAHLATPTIDSFKTVRQNVEALQKEYQEHAQDIVGEDSYRSYIMALKARMDGDILLLDVLISSLDEQRSIVPEASLVQLGRAIAQLKKAHQQANTCRYSSLYTIALKDGIEKDIVVAEIFQAVLRCYEMAVYRQEVEFAKFYKHLIDYVHNLADIQSADHLLWLLQSVCRMLEARCGNRPLPVLMDWSWVDPTVESKRRQSIFGLNGEKSKVMCYYWHPYWAVKVNYSELGRLIDKKGIAREGLVLVDATSPDQPIGRHLLVNDPSFPEISASIYNFRYLDKQGGSLPALFRADAAERAVRAYANRYMIGLHVTNIKAVHVVYLPAASVRYTGKKQSREIIMSGLGMVNQHMNTMLGKTQEFLQIYAI